MEELIKFVLSHLVDDPSAIVYENNGDKFIVKVPKSDMGRVIGRNGRIAKAIRTVLKAASKNGQYFNFDIVEA
ncbi:MAG: KH domain-containing protein [Firmicutes bacterium]|nr:KH domain-containing protein [Bacillota bacterium]